MEFLTARKGAAHLTSKHFRAMLEFIIGSGSYIADLHDNLSAAADVNNTITIHPGMLCHHGGIFLVDAAENVTYQNGSQNMKRIDLIVARYTKTAEGIENGEWVVLKGTPADANPVAPAHTEGNMQNGDLIDDCPVFKVTLNGLNVESVECLLPIVKPLADIITALSKKQSQITCGTAAPSGGEDGDVYIQFVE